MITTRYPKEITIAFVGRVEDVGRSGWDVIDRFAGRRPQLVDAVGVWCALGYAVLAVLARQAGEPQLPAFGVLVIWSGLPVFGLYLYFRSRDESFPVGRMLFWAVVFRLCGLIGGPFFEDDFYRYLWDGYRFATAGTPYGTPPEAFFVDPGVPDTFREVLDHINHPELPTIYGPTMQFVFLLGYWLWPGSIAALQSILILVDLATIALLLRLAPARSVMLYAWCPLVVKEVAFTAHPDGIGVCLLLAAIMLAQSCRWRSAAVCLGVAAGSKIFVLILTPFVLVGASARHWAVFAAVLAGLYTPFALSGGTDLASLLVFAREWEFNSAVFGVLTTALPAFETKLVLGIVYGGFWGYYYLRYRRNDARGIPRGDWLYGVLLVASPVINPWYLLWLLPFATIFPSAWAWTASIAVLLSYMTGLNMNDYSLQAYQQPTWARLVEFGLILLALAWPLFRPRPQGCRPPPWRR